MEFLYKAFQEHVLNTMKGEIMSCKICGRSSCDSSFHKSEELEAYKEAEKMSTRDVMYLIIENKDNEKRLLNVQKALDGEEFKD